MGGFDEFSKKPTQQKTTIPSKLVTLILVISTNILTLLLFSDRSIDLKWFPSTPKTNLWASNALLQKLNSTEAQLTAAQAQASDLHRRLLTSNSLLETLLTELGRAHGDKSEPGDLDRWLGEIDGELKLAIGPHKLPLGFTSNIGSNKIYAPLGSGCLKYQDELAQYMNYKAGAQCPSDDVFAQRLMLKGCEPLPRRRCHPKSPKNYAGPVPFPESLWRVPPDTSISWDPYTCKNYTCLVSRGDTKGTYDCKDCFDLGGREKTRWVVDGNSVSYGIDAVLALRPPGTIRIGLDIGGGSGTFAARMRERNVTVVTTSMNFDGPFNSFIASRGLISLHASVAHRLPFFENTLDVVHSMHVLSNWVPDVMLEFALYDVYRVLRPGGLFWLDHFFCVGAQVNETYVPMFERIGFKKVRWNLGRKVDRGEEKNEWYISALLEKPLT